MKKILKALFIVIILNFFILLNSFATENSINEIYKDYENKTEGTNLENKINDVEYEEKYNNSNSQIKDNNTKSQNEIENTDFVNDVNATNSENQTLDFSGTDEVKQVNGVWRMVRNGVVDYNYTGLGQNDYGTWYVKNGVVDFKVTETYFKDNKAYIVEGNKVVATVEKNTTTVMQVNGIWRMIKDGKVLYNYKGLGENENGIWYFEKGTITFNFTGSYTDENKTTYVLEKSKVMTNWTTVMQVNNVWRMVVNGIVDYAYTGLGSNGYGTWYVKNGVVDLRTTETYIEENNAYIVEGSKVVATVKPDTTTVMFVNGNWRMIKNGKVIYNYTGLGRNDLGLWLVQNGTIYFNYTGNYKAEDGKTYIIEKNKAVTKVMQVNNIWRMVIDGLVIYDYTGIGSNEYGNWYVKNGVVDLKTTETYFEGNKAYIVEGSKIVATVEKNTTTVMQVSGIWRMVKEGKVLYNYTGMGRNDLGLWFVQNGTIYFNYTGNYKAEDGKTYIIEKNKAVTRVMQVDNIWRMVIDGLVISNYTGIGSNEYGNWYVKNGVVDLKTTETYFEGNNAYIVEGSKVILVVPKDTTEVMQVNGIWRMIKSGEVLYNYTGIGKNSFGVWLVKDGKVNFDYTGNYKAEDGKTYIIEKSKAVTKVVQVDNVWRMVINGLVDLDYTGLGSNEYGTWYVKDGVVDQKYVGTYFEGDKAHIIEWSKLVVTVSKNTTEVMQINGFWRMVIKGEVNYNFTGVGSNSFGMWLLQNGTVNFNFTGNGYQDSDGSIYNIRNGKVREVISRAGHPGTMWIDEPQKNYSYGAKTLNVKGWALSQETGDVIQIYIDDRYMGEAKRVAREDVFKVYSHNEYGGRALTPYPGFYAEVYVSGLSRGTHTLTVVNVSSDRKTIIQSREVEFKLVRLATSKGIDVSKYQDDIDWDTVRRSGVDFAIIRIGYYLASSNTTIIDEKFERNYNECRRLGIAVGGYFYSYAFDSREGAIEAEKCLSIIRGRHFDMPIFLDVEDPLQENAIKGGRTDRNRLTDACVSFCDTMNRNGYSSGVYANLKFLNNYLDRGRLERYNIWLAQWKVSSPSYTGRYDLWQYTSEGAIPGIRGNVDMNYCYKKYF